MTEKSLQSPATAFDLPALELVRSSRAAMKLSRFLWTLFIVMPVVVMLAPWQQNIPSTGQVAAFAPLDRRQEVEAPITGRIVEWWVQEGTRVNTGDRLLEISDIDPELVTRLEQERSAIKGRLDAKVIAAESYQTQAENLIATRDLAMDAARFRRDVAKERVRAASENLEGRRATLIAAEAQLERHNRLIGPGYVSVRELEVAQRDLDVARTAVNAAVADLAAAENEQQSLEREIDRIEADANARIDSAKATIQDARAQIEDARRAMAQIEVQLSRQQSQLVTAPRDGIVFRLIARQGGEIVRQGDPLLVLVPDAAQRAVELWMDGNDAPLVAPGRHVRLQFEGWPAIQFAGWPSVAVGTFGGTVAMVDSTDDGAGRFRMLVVPDPNEPDWPSDAYLRQGVRAKGWVLLNQVSIGYELWRQLNGFPPVVAMREPVDDLARKRIGK